MDRLLQKFLMVLLLSGILVCWQGELRGQDIATLLEEKPHATGLNDGNQNDAQIQKPLREVLEALENQYQVRFAVNHEFIKGKFVNFPELEGFKNQEPSEILEQKIRAILTPLNLELQKSSVNNFYLIYQADKAPVEKVKPQEPGIKEKPHNEGANSLFTQKISYLASNRLILENKRQDLTVSGQVTSEEGEPLPGVNVVVQGTSEGTVSDVNGNYSIQASEEGTLVFSFVGYENREIPINGRSQINISLTESISELEEVVVIGYGTQRKRDLTGAVNQVDVEQFSEMPNVGLMQSLQGSVPGLNIGAVDQSGTSPSISIRGQTGLGGDAEPLIVVDGTIYRGELIDLNPANIESVEVLKDASSAAIYGSQASNGVILITTKSGEDAGGKPIINYSGKYTLQVPSNTLKPMNAEQYEEFYRDAFWNAGSRLPPDYLEPNPDFEIAPRLKTQGITQGYEQGRDIDWWGLLTGNGKINQHDISVRGSNEGVNYLVSGGFTDQEGFVRNDTYQRYNFRVNMGSDITDWLNVGFESFLTSSDYSGVSPSISEAFHLQPWAPLYDENGNYVLEPENGLNPMLQVQIDDDDKRMNLFGNFHADIKLPFLEGFNYRVRYSNNYRENDQAQFNPWGANFTSSGFKNSFVYKDWSFDNIVSYKKTFAEDHKLNLTLVYGVEKRFFESSQLSAENFSKTQLGYNKLEAGDPSLYSINTGAEEESSLYNMGRLFYSFRDKYLMTGTIRRDGFSGFGAEQKFGIFPSLAFGWVASEESFIQNSIGGMVDFLKLRASYGTTARRGVDRYQTKAKMAVGPSRVFGDGGSTTIGQSVSTLANPALGWETTTGLNVGVDFEIIESKISGNFEYYNNDTRDILYDIQLPNMTGFSSIPTNIGKVHNQGIELFLTGRVINNNDFNWEASVNLARNRNTIESILGVDNDGDGQEDDIVSNELFIGEPQNVIYDYKITGMWQLEDDQEGNIPSGFLPGTYKIADLNGDGEYTPADDRAIIGYQDPSYRFGIANTFGYKNFSLYVFVNSVQGGENYYYGDDSPYTDGAHYKIDQLSYSNVPTQNSSGWDYWMPENPDARYRRLDAPSSFAPRPYTQRNFVRLQDVSLSYNFSPTFLEDIKVNNLKVYLSGKNLVTLTKWRGWDPETGVGMQAGRPVMRNYTLGLNVQF